MTVNEHEPTLLDASVAVHVTVVVPTGKLELEAGVHTTAPTPGQLSDADAENVTFAAHAPLAALAVMLPGHVTTGACVSLTVTVKLHCPVFAAASVTVHVTVVTPFGKTEPDAGTHETLAPGQLSLPTGVV